MNNRIFARLALLELKARKAGRDRPIDFIIVIDPDEEFDPDMYEVIDIGAPDVYPLTQQDLEQEGDEPDIFRTFPS